MCSSCLPGVLPSEVDFPLFCCFFLASLLPRTLREDLFGLQGAHATIQPRGKHASAYISPQPCKRPSICLVLPRLHCYGETIPGSQPPGRGLKEACCSSPSACVGHTSRKKSSQLLPFVLKHKCCSGSDLQSAKVGANQANVRKPDSSWRYLGRNPRIYTLTRQ